MMRLARRPQTACGRIRAPLYRQKGRWSERLRTFAWSLLCVLLLAQPALAQDPTKGKGNGGGGDSSAFGKQNGDMFGPMQEFDSALPLYLQGDQLIYDTKGNRVIAKGNVEIFYNDNLLRADEVIYDQNASTLTAVGNVELKEKNGNIVRAERYTLTDDFRDGFVQSLSVVTRDESRITAERAERREGNVTEFSNAKFTACKSDNGMPPLWCVGGRKIVHDQVAQTISYQDAYLQFFGQPVFYMPYFQHADPTVKRKSGFLAPGYGASEDLGTMVEVPYYFALAPNYDFLFNPLYLSRQGVMWQGTWRHRLETGQYSVKFAALDQDPDELPDNTKPERREQLDQWRGSLETKGEFSLSSWWSYGWDVTLESDDTFRRFYKLDNILVTDRVNRVHLTGLGDRSYLGANLYHFGGLLINDTPEAESYVHPIIDYNYVFANPVLGGELRWDTNIMSFSRADTNVVLPGGEKREDINRAITEVKWRRRFIDPLGITYTPFGELRGDVYQVNNFTDPDSGAFVSDETLVRGRAMGGVTVAYPWVAHTANASHVIEPIGQVVTRQDSIDQRRLPDEDAKSLVFDDTNLFELDKFSGFDRLETGTRVNAGLQYTYQSANGGFYRFLAGQSYHLSGDNVFDDPGRTASGNFIYSPTSGLETDESDYVVGAYIAPIDYFRLISQSRFDDDNWELRREDLSMRLDYGPVFSRATYTYAAADPERGRENPLQDVIGAVGLRLSDHWSLIGRIRYDIENERRLTDSIRLRYLDECFMLSATYKETFVKDPQRDIEPDRTIMLRFELKHLGGFKYKTDILDHVYGDEQPPN